MRGKSWRRHHAARMKSRAKGLYRDHPKATYYADNLAVCSCPMCGNPRKWFGHITNQERRAASDE